MSPPLRVLMVCLGNICRSPTAHGVLAQMVEREGLAGRISVDSAGTGSWHVGHAPDARAEAHAARRGYDLSGQRARQLTPDDFRAFDLVLVMDDDNFRDAAAICPASERHELRRLTDFGSQGARAVPDPYYGGDDGFEHVLDLVEDACAGLLAAWREGRLTPRVA